MNTWQSLVPACAVAAVTWACASGPPAARPPSVIRTAMPDPRADPAPRRPVATYSIVARDPATGQLGVAVQSHWFSVGPVVPWAEAGVGAVATQSFVKIDYGPDGLAAMRAGRSATEALATLIEQDDKRDVRQVAMVDATGDVAVYTGDRCIVAAGHSLGRDFSVQANLMERDSVWPAMAAAYREAEGDLAERMLAALEAAEAEGGDIRGRQSAALLVVRGESTGRSWEDRLVDLRVEDHAEPLVELRRLLRLHRAYEHMNAGDEHFAAGDVEGAMQAYTRALEVAPESYEIAFWSGITPAGAGRTGDALPLLRRAYAGEPRLRALVPRLPASGLLPDDDELLGTLTARP